MASPSVQIRVDGDGRSTTPGSAAMSGDLRKTKRLRKGFGRRNEPSTHASIPSHYQAFFYATSEAQGFNAQAARFQEHLNINDTPGPGTYSTPLSSLNTFTTSTSKAGRGDFASKTHRFLGEKASKLGPGSYDLRLHPLRYDFNCTNISRFFQKPIVNESGRSNHAPSPSPTTYHPSHTHTKHNKIITAQAAFKSRTGRTLSSASDNVPSPGHYQVRDDLLHPTPSSHRSVFASKSHRHGIPKPTKCPGPADYSPHPPSNLTNDKTTTDHQGPLHTIPYHRQKHYLRISAPAMPLPPLPPSPGPGHYETQTHSFSTSHKPSSLTLKMKMMKKMKKTTDHPSHGCGFSSTVDRWKSSEMIRNDEDPGPGSYDPMKPLRKSYLYNLEHKWI